MPLHVTFAAVVLALSVPAVPPPAESDTVRAGSVRLGLSYYDVSGRLDDAVAMELAYASERLRLGPVRPHAGAMAAVDGTVYGYVGIEAPLELGAGLALVPFVGAGGYRAVQGTDLGSALEFRSGIEAEWRHPGGRAVSVYLYHLSNGGLGSRNPGLEVVGVGYSVPF